MNYHRYFLRADRPVEACIVGTGGFGRSFIAQARHVPLMNCRAAVDLTAEAAIDAFLATGLAREQIAACDTPGDAAAAWARGAFVAAADLATVIDLPVDIVVEATGEPEAGARHALMAIGNGRHLALVTKELDSVAGPGLARMGAERGLVVTPVDGDQPSLLIGLVTWAEVLGLEILAAGKSSEYDFVFDPDASTVTVNGETHCVPGFEALWEAGETGTAALFEARRRALAMFRQHAVPDLCELGIVANATGLLPDTPRFHAPVARVAEVPDAFSDAASGGLLGGGRRLDIFNCLRTGEQLSFAGGVFVSVRCHNRETWEMLGEKGHVLSRDGRTALLFTPRHLLGVEAPITVLEAVVNGVASGAAAPRPVVDLVARAADDLPAGTTLTAHGHHHVIDGLEPELVPAAPLSGESPVPFYLAANRQLRTDVAAGRLLQLSDVEFGTEPSCLVDLRRRQDAIFFGSPNPGQ